MKTVPLGEATEIVSGATPKTGNPEFWGGDILWATPADLSKLTGPYISSTPRTITAAGLRSCAAQVLPVGSVLLSSRAPIGHVAVNTEPMATNQGFKSLIPQPGVVDAKYLYHWLRANTEYLQSLGNGATFKEVSKAVVSKVEVPLPPLDEQRRIAAILDQADDLRLKRRAILARLSGLAQSVFVDMFAHSAPLTQIGDLCQLMVDCVNRTAPVVDGPTPYKMLRTTNVRDGRVDTTNVRFVEADTFVRWNRRATPRRGDVILTREAPVGEVGILDSDDQVFLGQRLFLYRPDPQKLTAEFLLAAFRSPTLTAQFERLGSGSTVKHLPLPACQNFLIPAPPLEQQIRFSARTSRVSGLIALNERNLVQEELLFQALQQKAFAGELLLDQGLLHV